MYTITDLFDLDHTLAKDYLAQLTPEVLDACLAAEARHVQLYLPRFSMETAGELKEVLKQMGIERAFSAADAEFGPMAENGARDLYVGSVLQKAKIQVGEEGTEAAAATAVEMLTKGVLRPTLEEPLEVRFDRSFLFAVVDPSLGLPLFSGIVAEPGE